MFPDKIYYEPSSLEYPLGKILQDKYHDRIWIPIESHNRIDELRTQSNQEFARMKQHLIIGVRKTHKFVPNEKISDFLVPYTSSGCSAMCLYCYLVCNYNKCSYLRLFVNREQMLGKIIKTANEAPESQVFEIGSNSDLVLENTITQNLEWTIEEFARAEKGSITFPTKFHMVEGLLGLRHNGRTIVRMSVNPQEIIRKVEIGTSKLEQRIQALNQLCEAGYPTGLLIAPVIFVENWKTLYAELLYVLAETLSPQVKRQSKIEVIFMTYSFVHRKINNDAFPNALELYDNAQMTGRGRGKYYYRNALREEGTTFFQQEISAKLPEMEILYIV